MVNELLWILLLVASYLGILVAYRFFGRAGLYAWVAMSVIIANLQVLKTVQLFGFVTALGNIIYGSIFLANDILSENHGKKAAQKGVLIGFFVLIMVTILMQISLQFAPDESDFLSPHLQALFEFFPQIAVASITAYLVSQSLNVFLFNKLKKKTEGKLLWLRNNASTFVGQLLDNVVFTYIAFIGLFGLFGFDQLLPWSIVVEIFLVSIVMKIVVAVLDTPIIYWARKLKE